MSDPDDYQSFIAEKGESVAFDSVPFKRLKRHLFPHQRDLVKWALRKGRAAIFADTGLGKTAMYLEWARHVAKIGPVLVLTPLAVAQQTVAEAEKFGTPARYLRSDDGKPGIVVANYEMLAHFDASRFAGVVLDESSILKNYSGKFRNLIIDSFATTPHRLAATATPAPNDFTELGNHSEFLGVKLRTEMLAEYFVHDGGSTQNWRVKGHAVTPFWRWVATWGAVVKLPSDLGHDDGAFRLPPLRMHEHLIRMSTDEANKAGFLFAQEATTLADQRATRRATIDSRVRIAARIAGEADGPVVVWCGLNAESTALAAAIPDSVEVSGSLDNDEKTRRLVAFSSGKARVIVTKPSIAGFGLNWQHAATMVFVAPSHSYEKTYQAIRRCWRFGQTRPVDVHFIVAETEGAVVANYRRKEADAERMGEEMRSRCRDAVLAEVTGRLRREWNPYQPTTEMTIPAWVGCEDEVTA